jgi:hypothetical protein
MAITNIRRDWGVGPSIVRIVTTDNLATITTAGYLTAQEDEIRALNNGDFAWVDTDYVLISYNGGIGFFLRDAVNATFVAAAVVPGTLANTLPSAQIFVGNAGNVATAVAMTGDVAINNAGATTIQAGAIDLAMLSAGITPSHVIKFGGQLTTVGGAAAEAFAVVGALAATDRAFVQIVDNGTNNVTALQAVVTNDTLTVTFSADPGNDCIFNYQIIRAAA